MISFVCATVALARVAPSAPPTLTVIRSFDAAEATQGVAVDDTYFYAITNRQIGKYKKSDGTKVAEFKEPEGGELIHMNGGIVANNQLYTFHSNYPGVPNISSIEIFDLNLKHQKSVSFGISRGSLVWAIPTKENWLVCFGQYNQKGGEPGTPNTYSRVEIMDKNFVSIGGYGFDPKVVERWDGMTCSGAAYSTDGYIYATGHHAPEIHRLQIPKAGGMLKLLDVIPSPCEGQGIAFDTHAGTIWQIQRKEKKVYELKINN